MWLWSCFGADDGSGFFRVGFSSGRCLLALGILGPQVFQSQDYKGMNEWLNYLVTDKPVALEFPIELDFKVLVFVEGGKPKNSEKTPRSREKNQH